MNALKMASCVLHRKSETCVLAHEKNPSIRLEVDISHAPKYLSTFAFTKNQHMVRDFGTFSKFDDNFHF